MSTRGDRAYGRVLLTPISLLYLLFLIAPISFFLAMSVFRYDAFELYVPTVSGENFARLLTDGYYRDIVIRTLRIALMTSLFSLLLGFPLAFFLARTTSRWRGVLLFLVIAPLMSGVIVRTYGWIILLGAEGAINRLLLGIGLVDEPVRMLNTEFAVLLALVHILMPYMVFPLFSSLASQDRDIERAAGTLGAGRVRTFWEVTLPLSRSGIAMGFALVFTLSAGSVVTPALLGGKDVQMLGQQIYELILSTLNWPLASACAVVLVICQLVVIALNFRGGRGHAR